MESDLRDRAIAVLKGNDQGLFTSPAEGLYPHQWLWDSCFIAIGMRHYDIDRAKTEIMSLLRGQWSNGMLPHMIFSGDDFFRRDRNVWRSWLSPYSPDGIATSGITQPPMLAEAVVRIGEKLPTAERKNWYKQLLPHLVAYHEWLYADRDPHNEGLLIQIHPYETGLDNTPPWVNQLHQHHLPWWATTLQKTNLDNLVNLVRRDTRHLPPGQRMSNMDALLYYDVIRRLRRKLYNTEAILNRSHFAVEDLTFNCIFIRGNQHIRDIAKTLRHELPDELLEKMIKSEKALEQLWDPYSGQYYSRNFVTHKLIKEPSIAGLMPLYAGCIKHERAAALIKQLESEKLFGAHYPVPSVPMNSTWFQADNFWQGPTWVNTNWLLIDGLRRLEFNDHAEALRDSTTDMVNQAGFAEYFNPMNGAPDGAKNFSWTAALTLDMLQK